jgi:hypothetical protein
MPGKASGDQPHMRGRSRYLLELLPEEYQHKLTDYEEVHGVRFDDLDILQQYEILGFLEVELEISYGEPVDYLEETPGDNVSTTLDELSCPNIFSGPYMEIQTIDSLDNPSRAAGSMADDSSHPSTTAAAVIDQLKRDLRSPDKPVLTPDDIEVMTQRGCTLEVVRALGRPREQRETLIEIYKIHLDIEAKRLKKEEEQEKKEDKEQEEQLEKEEDEEKEKDEEQEGESEKEQEEEQEEDEEQEENASGDGSEGQVSGSETRSAVQRSRNDKRKARREKARRLKHVSKQESQRRGTQDDVGKLVLQYCPRFT